VWLLGIAAEREVEERGAARIEDPCQAVAVGSGVGESAGGAAGSKLSADGFGTEGVKVLFEQIRTFA
jgi:hypothetical protein